MKCPHCGKTMRTIEHKIWGSGSWSFNLWPSNSQTIKEYEIDRDEDQSYYCNNPHCQAELDGETVAKFLKER